MINKNWQGIEPDPIALEHEIVRLNEAVDAFAVVMKKKLEQKAKEGWTGWDSLDAREAIYNNLLAHAAGFPLAARQEVDIANLAMMLWRLSGAA